VVYVGDLVVGPGETRAQAAEQLEHFTEIAVAAVREPPSTAPHVGDVGGYLRQLRKLEIVEIGDLIELRPSQAGRCWGACPEDRAVIAERADRLRRIAAAELAAHARLVDEAR
jgi:hypothetical protein